MLPASPIDVLLSFVTRYTVNCAERRWTVESLKVVMLIGQAVSLMPAFVLFLFDDDKALGEESEPLTSRNPSTAQLGAVQGHLFCLSLK